MKSSVDTTGTLIRILSNNTELSSQHTVDNLLAEKELTLEKRIQHIVRQYVILRCSFNTTFQFCHDVIYPKIQPQFGHKAPGQQKPRVIEVPGTLTVRPNQIIANPEQKAVT
ncbi:hypothetical protein TUM19329_34590 [Legionella antarctica]|uniref:Uncharacterized protein n=1 Tax=Legionella antarctica TaxID=2708020 RepID=A0A6F8T9S1_9GAMM|nr:hypothetical protein [Legionella antarctica]BCA97098.1 hypothetical protein TUM19329_34590 [Legionella antarctica]